MKHSLAVCAALVLPVLAMAKPPAQDPKVQLGSRLFFDANLSNPPGQSCASCHSPRHGFTDPDKRTPTSGGILPGRFGNRNAPSAAYAAHSPEFHYDSARNGYVGGQFWDGRAPTLEEQAKGPLLNPLEMNNTGHAMVIDKVRAASYAPLFRSVFGPDSLNDPDLAYDYLASAIAAFERTATFNKFSSKYDAYLAGTAQLTPQELNGLATFEDPDKGNCAACHSSRPAADGTPPLFTDFSYSNLGVPKNPGNPFYTLPLELNPTGWNFVDRGLGGALDNPAEDGKFKVPTLRNIALTSPYTHNGYFKTLRGVVAFYNSRDTVRACRNPFTTEKIALAHGCWPAPEMPSNVNRTELGHLGLTEQEIDDLVAFLGTLTDGYQPGP